MNNQNYQILHNNFFEQNIFIENAWCKSCDKFHVGIFGPEEFEVYGDKYIHAYCRNCGTKFVSEIIKKNIAA